jgi:hypothetical protein
MIIANPIYDVVFKKMMENERVAKFFIGTLLDQTIESIEVKPQELIYKDEMAGLAVFRLDFVATIKTESGEYKKVLIEIQKAKNSVDVMRFRRYLAEQYKKEDLVNHNKVALPITTIYILGFPIPNIDTPCIKVARNYKDQINKTIIDVKSDFIEKLTHDCFVVQVGKITNSYQTKLEKLLSIFEQSNFIDDSILIKEFTHNVDLEEIKIATDILHHTCTNPEEKKKIEDEEEAWRSYYAMYGEKERDLLNSIKEKEIVIQHLDKELEFKDKELEFKDKEIEDKDKALEDKDKLIAELLKKIG